jgi:hypothetical protein
MKLNNPAVQCDLHHKLTGMNQMSPALEEEDST